MVLQKYNHTYFAILQRWLTDADFLFQFAGPDWEFPLTQMQLDNYTEQNPHKQFYMGIHDDNTPVAFGEIIFQGQYSPRLGRLLIGGAENRRKGYGQIFIRCLTNECMILMKPQKIFLYVLDKNLTAINCYLKSGFEIDTSYTGHLTHNHVDHNVLLMHFNIQ
jgi:RimJ/RimL family protein N-acetyltransferase